MNRANQIIYSAIRSLPSLFKIDHYKILFKHLVKHRETENSDEVHLKAALSWLTSANEIVKQKGISGIYSLLEGWHYSYPETTGYSIETFINYYLKYRDENILALTFKIADWEIDIQLPNGAVRGYCMTNGLSDEPMIFDTGQVVIGWNSLYNFCHDKKYLAASIKACGWLIQNQNENGTWDNFLYKNHCGTYFTKAAFALIETGIESDNENMVNRGIKFLDWALTQQNQNGFLNHMGFFPTRKVFTHTISYTIEGLLNSAAILKDINPELSQKYYCAVQLILDNLASVFFRDKTFYGEYSKEWEPISKNYTCLTGIAQLSCCYFKMYAVCKENNYLVIANNLINILKRTQILDIKNKAIYGGIFGSYPIWGRYQRWRIVSWGAKYFIDALLEKNKLELSNSIINSNNNSPSINLQGKEK